ncbi:MAG TPA: carboxypeptidase-like regulatory domain-containing protein [Candidatus Baltobacteraceae bacterium]|nr:carboxypeptidase-like regulatory domain-containing protein [Candidatus Baltobacteraceae bacterium]
MIRRISVFVFLCSLCFAFVLILSTPAQQTLGSITGAISDSTGALITDATVTAVNDQTGLTRTVMSGSDGTYNIVNLPIGNYTITYTHNGFESQKIPSILVQANRTVTVDAQLKVGEVTQTVTVEETPLLNAVDTTNGYVLDKSQIDAVPLPTGSFTGVAILSSGVSAELSGGTGSNSGLGNAPIWANGQRDTSNTFLLNGVDAKNLFNGKTTSQVASARVVNATGVSTSSALSSLPVQSSSSVYLAIGEAIPSPAPETLQELRVNTSMYDAQQGSTSGAHIDMSTSSGTNDIHGQLYGHRESNWLNADPYYYNADPNIPDDEKNPSLHRYTAGGAIGLPIIKNKLFFYGSYQHTHVSDEEIGISRITVPAGLTNDRSAAALAAVGNNNNLFGVLGLDDGTVNPTVGLGMGDINPIAYTFFNYQFPNGPLKGQYLIPSANPNAVELNTTNAALIEAFPEDAEIPGKAFFWADQAVSDIDWNPNGKHSFAAKYYYQHDPTTAPYGYSSLAGFTQHLDAGSQVVSLNHTQVVKPNLSVTETFGFIREKAYSTLAQPFTPAQFGSACQALTDFDAADCTINTFGSPVFPGLTINWPGVMGSNGATPPSYQPLLNIGAGAESMGAFTGVFQNRFNPSADAIWTIGRHSITFGGSFSYTQLNTRDRRNELGMIESEDVNQFLTGTLTDDYVYSGTLFLSGNPNRHWRANETGEYIQDKFQFRPNISITAGLRFDYEGGLTEKNGLLLNFDPTKYAYDPASDTITSSGLIVAGNSAHGTPGVSNSTLTGRQWGFAPRIGLAWSPKMFNNKLVVRAGWGMYYDRGELFTYLSPAVAQSITPGGPFGIDQQQPFVGTQFCPVEFPGTFETCETTLSNPWGATLEPPPSGNPNTIATTIDPGTGLPVLPNASALEEGAQPFYLGVYNRKNKLPYTMNQTLDIQWQPRNDLAIDVGYVGNLGRHEIIPLPFNQARVATPTNPLCGPAAVCTAALNDPNCVSTPSCPEAPHAQFWTYGYTVQTAPDAFFDENPLQLPNGTFQQLNSEGGNVDERVPYIGYAGESESYTAAGVSSYNALQAHVEKRLSHGLQAGVSYTYSHSLDEQSALGLFYNGSNPLDLRGGYGNSDFDRTHIFNIDYHYELPNFYSPTSIEGRFTDGWTVQGLITIQSGQPYSVVDYSGAVGSIYYSINDGITNPIVPLAPGCTPKNATTGAVGNNFDFPALKASCFDVPILAPGDLNGGIPPGDTFETNFIQNGGQRNIFRQSWQKVADLSIVKQTKINDRFTMRYSFDVFNLTNHPSFDIPIDNVDQNLAFSELPMQGSQVLATGCGTASASNGFYFCPTGLGQVVKTIGSGREIQMSLGLQF